MNILQAKYSSWLSWSQPFIHNLVSALDEHVRNIVLCERTENLDRFPAREICRVPAHHLVRPRLAVETAARLREQYQPSLIHAHFGWTGIRLVLLKQLLRVPMVVTFGGRDLGLQMAIPEFKKSYRILLEAADRVICVSADLAERALAQGVPPSRVEILRRGVNLQRFPFCDRAQRKVERVRLLTVGRLVEKKGNEHALQALRRLHDWGMPAQLDVVGEGERETSLRRLAKKLRVADSVHFLGSTNQDGVRAAMHQADLLVHCSITPASGDVEGIPNVVVEAQSTGLPVVATRHGGIPEAVVAEQTALLVAERDPDALAHALAALIREPARRQLMGSAARRWTEEHFDFRRSVARHVEIYRDLGERCSRDREWLTRNWLPDDFADSSSVLLGCSGHPAEFSLAELALQAFTSGEGGLDDGAPSAGRMTLLERLYDQKRHLPSSIKFPLKRALGMCLAAIITRRSGYDHEADQRVLAELRSGADTGGGAAPARERRAEP